MVTAECFGSLARSNDGLHFLGAQRRRRLTPKNLCAMGTPVATVVRYSSPPLPLRARALCRVARAAVQSVEQRWQGQECRVEARRSGFGWPQTHRASPPRMRTSARFAAQVRDAGPAISTALAGLDPCDGVAGSKTTATRASPATASMSSSSSLTFVSDHHQREPGGVAAWLREARHMAAAETDVLEDLILYLGIIVRDNIINFAQDRDSREWTVGY